MDPLSMSPAPGERLVRYVGDRQSFSLTTPPEASPAHGWQARLRTTLGRDAAFREEVVKAHTARVPPFGAAWHDVPLQWTGTRWARDLVLAETGFFGAKPYLIDPKGYQHWPSGPDCGISIHPDWCRTANIIYCAFTRLFGQTRFASQLHPESTQPAVQALEQCGFAVLPPSGTFRQLQAQLPHIVNTLGCRILHLLPIHPTPTTFARFGRMGSPYAALDLTAVDPALVEFDQRATGIDQFRELADATHDLGARVFLDIVVNHTGWGSRLFEEHPEFFRREKDGRFACPGAWGVIWEDLVELEQERVELWDLIAEALLTWCRRGVDGFRCDAGYKIPTHVWQYITSRVRSEFPDAVFLLEGLGGSWAATESLLTEGGMQWAYSELFQNYSGPDIQGYLDYALAQSRRVGTYVHYSETHDNSRLAANGRTWSLLRNRLCALTSVSGGFGFTCGVEWLASEKIRVHERTGLSWDSPDHIVPELATLHRLLADHPAFFDGARLERISPDGHTIYALLRTSQDGSSPVLVLINSQLEKPSVLSTASAPFRTAAEWTHELISNAPNPISRGSGGAQECRIELPPGAVCCLSPHPLPTQGAGDRYRECRARAAWAIQAAAAIVPAESILGDLQPFRLAEVVAEKAAEWLACLSHLAAPAPQGTRPIEINLNQALEVCLRNGAFPNVIEWSPSDARRVTPIPPGWWLLIRLPSAFRAHLEIASEPRPRHAFSIRVADGWIASFPPLSPLHSLSARLSIDLRQDQGPDSVHAPLLFLGLQPRSTAPLDREGLALLTNGRGAMARLRLDLGSVRSKYDCALAANLHPRVPVDRHVLVKRVRAWINVDGFLSPLDFQNLTDFRLEDGVAHWTFHANAGNGRRVTILLSAAMISQRNTTTFRFARPIGDTALPATLTIRVDIEDRSFHQETQRNPGSEHHFHAHTRSLEKPAGFAFTPADDRTLRVTTNRGVYHPQPEWSERVPHPIEQSRGQVGHGDAFSPGWFECPLDAGDVLQLMLDAETSPLGMEADGSLDRSRDTGDARQGLDGLELRLRRAALDFLARRDGGQTVIAGYPWFLDWGRDTLIAARGLLAGGWHQEVVGILDVFGRFADRGTLPNSIHGDNATNRDTSDAPLWYAVVAEEALTLLGPDLAHRTLPGTSRGLVDTVRLLVEGYLSGTPNGIRVDPATGLVWSPAHFTWMDTNHPACTPREGYPIEIQALWIRALRFLSRADGNATERWKKLAELAVRSVAERFWLPSSGWFSDVLLAAPGVSAANARPDNALRPNFLFLITLGIADTAQARSAVNSALRHLWIPGGVRSLAPLPVSPPLAARAADGRLLNDPDQPYWGQYRDDEDTRRKPAYHNGTAWTWILPSLAEALVVAWERHPSAIAAAQAMLGNLDYWLDYGCLGHVPEIADGDAPHQERGCDAQAWSATEALRVLKWLRQQALSVPDSP
ncbi:MAG: glycogen debranching enzyme N-terminal domain-containing protein [Verrucomicrobiales bacterium]|nr:glycogen debranching enzyme N-terminal domain-containing protein [Verrucomicrobiales bacterium]